MSDEVHCMRIGHGFDVHRHGEGDGVVLGGVWIPHHQGLIAHSDGDVMVHALCDAVLGALGEGDIGRHFPDTDDRWESVSSRVLLREVATLMLNRGMVLGNADITVVAQAPRLSPHIAEMVRNLAADLQAEPERLNIKATTTEGLGYTGREEGIAAHAVVLLIERR